MTAYELASNEKLVISAALDENKFKSNANLTLTLTSDNDSINTNGSLTYDEVIKDMNIALNDTIKVDPSVTNDFAYNRLVQSSIEDASDLDFTGCTDMSYAFSMCSNLVTAPNIPVGVETFEGAFNGCGKLTTIGVIDMGACSNCDQMFENCTSLSGVSMTNVPRNLSTTIIGIPEANINIVSYKELSDTAFVDEGEFWSKTFKLQNWDSINGTQDIVGATLVWESNVRISTSCTKELLTFADSEFSSGSTTFAITVTLNDGRSVTKTFTRRHSGG